MIDKLAKSDETIGGIKAKECMFRINRDVRFQKTNLLTKLILAHLSIRGEKNPTLPDTISILEPGASFVGGGIWMPMPKELAQDTGRRSTIASVNLNNSDRSAGFKKAIRRNIPGR